MNYCAQATSLPRFSIVLDMTFLTTVIPPLRGTWQLVTDDTYNELNAKLPGNLIVKGKDMPLRSFLLVHNVALNLHTHYH